MGSACMKAGKSRWSGFWGGSVLQDGKMMERLTQVGLVDPDEVSSSRCHLARPTPLRPLLRSPWAVAVRKSSSTLRPLPFARGLPQSVGCRRSVVHVRHLPVRPLA